MNYFYFSYSGKELIGCMAYPQADAEFDIVGAYKFLAERKTGAVIILTWHPISEKRFQEWKAFTHSLPPHTPKNHLKLVSLS